jgi:hypothetical protein
VAIADDLCSLFAMVLGSVKGHVSKFRILLTSAQLSTANALSEALRSSSTLFPHIHDLAYSLLSDCHTATAEDKFECVHVRHIILSHLHPDGTFSTPSAISSAISRKKWHMRATGTFESVEQKENYKRKMFGYAFQVISG